MRKDWVVNTPDQMANVCRLLGKAKVERTLRVTVEHYIATRSYEQNARYWAILGDAAKEIGCGAQELHEEMLCERFGADEYQMPTGRVTRTPRRRSSGLDKKEFSEYMDFVETFLAEKLGMTFQ